MSLAGRAPVRGHARTCYGTRAGWATVAAVRPREVQAKAATADVLALGNLCVDVVIKMPELPPHDTVVRRRLLSELTQTTTPEDTSNWEVGGNCNFIVAAARLGLDVSTIGHTGDDMFGRFMEDVLQGEEIVGMERILTHGAAEALASANASADEGAGSGASNSTLPSPPAPTHPALEDVNQTLVCFVLVDPSHHHAFVSRYDFGPWPLLGGLSQLPKRALKALERTRAVFTNGFVFDELPLAVVRHACQHAISHGAAVFFDPGPRCFTMMEGERRAALDEIMDLSEVVLMTEEEAVTVTGHVDPEAAARSVLARPGSRTQWCVIKMGGQGAVLVSKPSGKAFRVPGFKVQVQDTVGCGDSFASAIVMGYIQKAPEEATLTLANAVGAATATGLGAGRNVASLHQVLRLLIEASTGGSPRVQAALDMVVRATAPA